MNDLFIRAACMDWDGVGKDSYIWDIDAIAGATITTNGYLKAIERAFECVTIFEGGNNQ